MKKNQGEKTPSEITGKRNRIKTEIGNNYFFVSRDDIMLTVADENDNKQAGVRALTETLCRVASKAMQAGVPMCTIIEQMRKGDSGRCTILSEMVEVMERYCDSCGHSLYVHGDRSPGR